MTHAGLSQVENFVPVFWKSLMPEFPVVASSPEEQQQLEEEERQTDPDIPQPLLLEAALAAGSSSASSSFSSLPMLRSSASSASFPSIVPSFAVPTDTDCDSLFQLRGTVQRHLEQVIHRYMRLMVSQTGGVEDVHS